MDGTSLSIAFVAGGLATLNPCGFPLLPAFFSYYTGAADERLPSAPTRVAQGLASGLLVTLGSLGVFTVLGLPVSLGATTVADAVPWVGLAIGVLLALAGVVALAGRGVTLPVRGPARLGAARRGEAMVLFGIGYGAASLGCTLPIFLVLLGASLTSGGAVATLVVFASYGLGMGVVLTALALGAALVRSGIGRGLRSLVPYMSRISGALLVLSGGYLVYYWARIRFGPSSTLADDPIVGVVTRFTAELQSHAAGDGRIVLAAAATGVALAIGAAAGQRRRRRQRDARAGRLARS
jgi:cytochrome c biogenesis protein CcdA